MAGINVWHYVPVFVCNHQLLGYNICHYVPVTWMAPERKHGYLPYSAAPFIPSSILHCTSASPYVTYNTLYTWALTHVWFRTVQYTVYQLFFGGHTQQHTRTPNNRQQHTTTVHNSTQIHKITNVPLFKKLWAHKVIVPQKKIMSRSFLNSGTLIVIFTKSLVRFQPQELCNYYYAF